MAIPHCLIYFCTMIYLNKIVQNYKSAISRKGSVWGFISARIINYLRRVCQIYKKSIYIAISIHIESPYKALTANIKSILKVISPPFASVRLVYGFIWERSNTVPFYTGLSPPGREVNSDDTTVFVIF